MRESEFRFMQCPHCGNKFMYELFDFGEQVPRCPKCGRLFTLTIKNDTAHQMMTRPDDRKRSDFSSHLKVSFMATLIIALMIGASILIPVLAVITQSPILVILGILGFFFLIFLLLAYSKNL